MEYIAEFDGRMVRATYDLVNDEIVVSGIKVMKAGSWEEQTGRRGGSGVTRFPTATFRILIFVEGRNPRVEHGA